MGSMSIGGDGKSRPASAPACARCGGGAPAQSGDGAPAPYHLLAELAAPSALLHVHVMLQSYLCHVGRAVRLVFFAISHQHRCHRAKNSVEQLTVGVAHDAPAMEVCRQNHQKTAREQSTRCAHFQLPCRSERILPLQAKPATNTPTVALVSYLLASSYCYVVSIYKLAS